MITSILFHGKIIVVSFIGIVSCLLCTSCENNPKSLSDFINLEEVDSVLMNNNSGKHKIPDAKLDAFLENIGESKLESGSYKMGNIGFTIYSNEKELKFSGRTNGNILETHTDNLENISSDEWIYFKNDDLNLDNY